MLLYMLYFQCFFSVSLLLKTIVDIYQQTGDRPSGGAICIVNTSVHVGSNIKFSFLAGKCQLVFPVFQNIYISGNRGKESVDDRFV